MKFVASPALDTDAMFPAAAAPSLIYTDTETVRIYR